MTERKKRGRKPTGSQLVGKTLKLLDEHWEIAKEAGNGMATRGVRAALIEWKERRSE